MTDSQSSETLFAAAISAQQLQQHERAAELFLGILRLDVDSVAARHNLAFSYRALGRLAEAEALWRELIQAAPQFPLAPAALGNLLRAQALQLSANARTRALAEARELHMHALALDPLQAGHAHNLFLTLSAAEAWEETAAVFAAQATAHPEVAHFAELAARALVRLGHFDQALTWANTALGLSPVNIDALISHASCLREQGHAQAAERSLEQACAADPQHAVAAFNLAQLRCFRGRWAEGLAGIAADRERQVQAGALRGPRGTSLWRGEFKPHAHLLLLAEQGLGDTLQLIRYAAAARARVGRITLVPPAGLATDHAWLQPLLRNVAGVDSVLRPADPIPPADVFLPMFSLPHVCGSSPDKVLAFDHYLRANAERSLHWGQQLGPRAAEFRVALAWQGNPQYRGDQRRSIPLANFTPLVGDGNLKVRWLSVQKGFGATQLEQLPTPCVIEDWGKRLDLGAESFTDTAAFLEHVDLVITSDTSLPHLAGALGRPTWLLLSAVPDWRWQEDGELSPWYPRMRIFRQPRAHDWPSAVQLVKRALIDVVRK